MALRNAREVFFYPLGLTDSFEQTFSFSGGCLKLTNLIQDQNNIGVMVARPGVTTLVDMAVTGPWTSAGPKIISVFLVIGTRIYGMVGLSSGTYAGYDVPFCYDTSTSSFLTITGLTTGNLPTTQTQTSPFTLWTPPTMAMAGNTQVLVTHPGFAGNATTGTYFGVLDMSGLTSISLGSGTVSGYTIISLSTNPITAGVRAGMTITDGGTHIPAGSYVVGLTSTTVRINQALTGSGSVTSIVVSGGTSSSPQWGCCGLNNNATGTSLITSVPSSVTAYNNRAWYAVGNAALYSDVLSATMSSSTAVPSLTMGDSAPLVTLSNLPILTNSSGVLAALIAFKGSGQSIWQVTGDAANNTLSLQNLSPNLGCWGPRTVVPTPQGIYFQGIDGVYVVNVLGQIQPLTNKQGDYRIDLSDPFVEATRAQASHAAAAYNQGIYRISLETNWRGQNYSGVNSLDFWFDDHNRRWSGPHTFTYHCAQSYLDHFILTSNWAPGKLFESYPDQHAGSTFYDPSQTDNTGVTYSGTYSCEMLTSLMPSTADMSMNSIVETTVEFGHSAIPSAYTIAAQDDKGNTLNAAQLNLSQQGYLWGAQNWGSFTWQSGTFLSGQYQVAWTAPIVFKRIAIDVVAPASSAVSMGEVAMRYQKLNYLLASTS